MSEEKETFVPEKSKFDEDRQSDNELTIRKDGSSEEEIAILETEKDFHSEKKTLLVRYATFIVDHPYVFFVVIAVMLPIFAIFSFIPQLGAKPLPDLTDPFFGFEVRGTEISDRWRSQANLINSEKKGEVSRFPAICGIKNPMKGREINDVPAVCTKEQTTSQGRLIVKLVFTTTNGESLLSADNLKSICRLEHKAIRTYKGFNDLCHKVNGTRHCCPSWSVGHYVAILTNVASCTDIQDNQVDEVATLLKNCSTYYHKQKLKPDCWNFETNQVDMKKCKSVPENCSKYNAVYNILHYLTDKGFLSNNQNLFLRYSLVLVPMAENKKFQKNVYKSNLKDKEMTDGNVKLTSYELSQLKMQIFVEVGLIQLYLPSIAMNLIMVILWLYTHSLILTVLIGMIMQCSLLIAYFIYTIVIDLDSFPNLNIFTFVLMVGIAADNAFLYVDLWSEAKDKLKQETGRDVPSTDKDLTRKDLVNLTVTTLKHAAASMFVTNFTTAAAFFTGLTSVITPIRLFAIYAGTSMICMLLLMLTWYPAAVIIVHSKPRKRGLSDKLCDHLNTIFKRCCDINAIVAKLVLWHNNFHKKILPNLVIRLRYFWVIFLSLVAVGGFIVTFLEPRLKPPSSPVFQMFQKSHELEKYPFKVRNYFHFESTKRAGFPISLIWGTKPIDKGDKFNPVSFGPITWDGDFDLANKESQEWIRGFISRLKKQPYVLDFGKKSFLEEFFDDMETANCTKENRLCCENTKFPYNSTVFNKCLLQRHCKKLKDVKLGSGFMSEGSPLYDSDENIKAMTLNFVSNVGFTTSFNPAKKFWDTSRSWIDNELHQSPPFSRGWYISTLEFYDLQRSLSSGIFVSMSISLGVSFAVMLITTGNLFISVFAFITILFILAVTTGSLVLVGWELSILESLTLSCSVGLAVDFALHYGIAFVLAENKSNRKDRVFFSITEMSSAVTMAAFTTFLTGAIDALGDTVSYLILGQFLMLIMTTSWVYSTFFFQALCAVFGPQNDTGQITKPKLKVAYGRLKSCYRCEYDNPDGYQFVKKPDGTQIKRPAKVIYVK